MAQQVKLRADDYKFILQAYQRGELWPAGQTLRDSTSAGSPIDLNWFREKKQRQTFSSEFW